MASASGGGRDVEDERQHQLIARACLSQYASLNDRRTRPTIRPDGRHEWTVLAGVVLSWGDDSAHRRQYRCIALATGVKAQPYCTLSPHGDVLHDCHAEVLARRSTRQWLVDRILVERLGGDLGDVPAIFDSGSSHSPRSSVRKGYTFHLYCSSLPCGDMSSNTILQKRGHDSHQTSAPQKASSHCGASEERLLLLRGRNDLSHGTVILRTKPGRPQSDPTISLSCTDKLAQWAMTGFQGSLLTRWTGGLFFASYTIGLEGFKAALSPRDELSTQLQQLRGDLRSILRSKCQDSTSMPDVGFTTETFPCGEQMIIERVLQESHDARVSGPSDELSIVASGLSIVWTRTLNTRIECVVDGRKQGSSSKRYPSLPFTSKQRSRLCKLDFFMAYSQMCHILEIDEDRDLIATNGTIRSYHDCKNYSQSPLVTAYRQAKQRARGTLDMTLEQRAAYEENCVAQFLDTETIRLSRLPATDLAPAPLLGWPVAGRRWESFDLDGVVNPTNQ